MSFDRPGKLERWENLVIAFDDLIFCAMQPPRPDTNIDTSESTQDIRTEEELRNLAYGEESMRTTSMERRSEDMPPLLGRDALGIGSDHFPSPLSRIHTPPSPEQAHVQPADSTNESGNAFNWL